METLHHMVSRNVHGVQKYCSDISLSIFLSIIEVDFLTWRNLKSWRGGGPRGPRGSCTYACTCMEIYARFVNGVELFSYPLTSSTSNMKLRSQLNHHQSIFLTQWTAEGSVFSPFSLWVFSLSTKYLGNRWTDLRQIHTEDVFCPSRWQFGGQGQRSKVTRDKNGIFSAFSAACVRFMFGKNIFSF